MRLNGILAIAALLAAAVIGGVSSRDETGPAAPDPAPQVQPQTRDLGAPTALRRLKVAPEGSDAGYERSQFGASLSSADPDRNGCPTREDIMARDLVDTTIEPDCNVVAGTLSPDPYTGKEVVYSESYPSGVQIDHRVPLSYAWKQDASTWTRAKRVAFANDPANLIAVYGRANSSKGDSGPGEWLPINKAYRCPYARGFIQVAYKYRLSITPADYDSLTVTLNGCRPA